ncbi:MAG TPA: TonB-dependent receptor [Sphingomicrobium sp.]|nr:TonB-dependent receptor [Sphingomicrobium sp.]
MLAAVLPGMWMVLAAAAVQPASNPSPAPAQPPESLKTIVITGTRIAVPNRKSASPIETVRHEDFVLTGVPNVEETLNQLPQLAPSFTNTSNNPGTGAATLDLRGLGSVRTLILVNGRRWIANDAGQIPEIDVNTIPAALIDHVDIVTGGASAVYGSDAVTGVVNFVLKRKLDGLYLEANNNITARGDGESRSADLSFGTSFLKGRGNLIAAVGWLDQKPVLQGERNFSRFTLTDGCVISGTANRFGASTAADDPNFPCTAEGTEPGFFEAGSAIAPAGAIRGPTFLPGPGDTLIRSGGTVFTPDGSLRRFNPATDSYNYAPDNYLQVPLRRVSGNLIGSIHISDAFEPYTELSYIRTRSSQQLAAAPGFLGGGEGAVPVFHVNLDNPYLSQQAREVLDISYGVDAAGNRGFLGSPDTGFTRNPAYQGDADGLVGLPGVFFTRLTGLGPRQGRNRRNAYRLLGGMRGQITSSLDYDFYFSTSSARHVAPLLNGGSAMRLQQAILARRDSGTGAVSCIDPSNGCVPVNIFGVQDISPEAIDFIANDAEQRTKVRESIAEAVVRGEMLELPAGPLRAAFGAGWRRMSYNFMPDRSLELGDNLGYLPAIGASGTTRARELFAEAYVPLLKDRRFAEEMWADLGLRYSNYDTVGGVWTWKAMLSWSPIAPVRFRGGLQRAVRAPNVRELFAEPATDFGGGVDPCDPALPFLQDPTIQAACIRNGAADLAPGGSDATIVRTSGSTNIKPETATTVTLGVALQPWKWFNLTVDYYDIDIRDAIGPFGGGATPTVFGCLLGGADPSDPLCQAYVRDETGAITFMDLPTANLPRIRATGVDWQLATGFPLLAGKLNLNLSGTRLFKSGTQPNAHVGLINCAGSFGGPCGLTIANGAQPRWKLYDRASWTSGPITLTLRHRFFSRTADARIAGMAAFGQPAPLDTIAVNGRYMAARHYFDASIGFDVAKRFTLTIGANNLAGTKPALVGDQQVQANTDPSLYDVLGRRFFVSLVARLR